MSHVVVCRSSWRHTDRYHQPAEDDESEPACRFRDREGMRFRTIDPDALPADAEECRFCSGEAHSAGGQGSKLAAKLADADPEEVVGQ